MDIEKRVLKLEEKLNKITNILTDKNEFENLDVLGDSNVKQIFGTVRMKNAMLIYPIITDADVAARESKGIGVESRTALIAIDNTPENISAIERAFKSAIEYGIQGGILTPDMTPSKIIGEMGQNPFVTDIDAWLNSLSGDTESLRQMLEGKRLLKNCKVSTDPERSTVILNKDGNPFPQDHKVQLGAIAEITINFAAYKYMNKRGIGRYIQGMRIMSDVDTNSPTSLYF